MEGRELLDSIFGVQAPIGCYQWRVGPLLIAWIDCTLVSISFITNKALSCLYCTRRHFLCFASKESVSSEVRMKKRVHPLERQVGARSKEVTLEKD